MTVRVMLAVAMLAVGAAAALGAGSRDEALAALRDTGDVEARRRGARLLAESGTMADLPLLADALRDPDPTVRGFAEAAMWSVWSRSGDDEIDKLFQVGVMQLSDRRFVPAVRTFTLIIQRKPDFAEGWNKRATAYFLLGEFDKSLADCDEVMKRNPWHWGALSGYGMIHLQESRPAQALAYFEKAIAVNPNLPQVQETIEMLKALLIQRRKDMIQWPHTLRRTT
jgi:tetratricopeptide (TPR) repeat protein